jgi:PEP-CTERM motif
MRTSGAIMRWFMAGLLGLAAAMPTHATTVRYDLSLVSGTTWQYNFSVTNDSLATSIDEFTIFFDQTLFSNLLLVSAPVGWDPLAIQPDPGLPQDGYFDWLALSTGIGQGQSLGSFRVRVNYGGNGAPGSSLFNVIDPKTFQTLDEGFTTATVTAIPEPSTIALMTSGLLFTLLRGRSRAARKRKSSI